MQIDELGLKLLLLFTPGMVAFIVKEKFIGKRKRDLTQLVIQSIVFGFVSYFGLQLIFWLKNNIPALWGTPTTDTAIVFFKALTNKNAPVNITEVGWASMVGLMLGVIGAAFENHGWLFLWAGKLKITRKITDNELIEFIFNRYPDKWLTLRDKELGVAYLGWVEIWPDDEDGEFIFLKDVSVYSEKEWQLLYELDAACLNFKKQGVILEFPKQIPRENNNG